tara:strand:- start:304 stop:492 length:189 start_codon:yes stop_codon:yes gene_type:complete
MEEKYETLLKRQSIIEERMDEMDAQFELVGQLLEKLTERSSSLLAQVRGLNKTLVMISKDKE